MDEDLKSEDKGLPTEKRCEYEKEGKRCRAFKITNSQYCFTHSDDPAIITMRQEALRKAADSKKLYLPFKPQDGVVSLNMPKFIDLNKSKGIKKAYMTIIRAAAMGGIDEKKLGALTYALNGYISAWDKILMLERIERLEHFAREKGVLLEDEQ